MERRVVGRKAIQDAARRWRSRGLTIVFTNGIFDLLHRAHVDLLIKAKSYGDILVVGLNSDASTRRLKGPNRPINRQADRARVLAALEPVDYVCIFSEDTPLELIETIRPHVLVKGSEYKTSEIVGAKEVRSWGGKVRRFRMRPGYSTTKLARRLK
jgi:D-beta-D-heptose 7-phosphate kinase/D-beta-D-heptose 1-phosphate adenosyltransferase